MSLGVAFALTAERAEELLVLSNDDSREEWLQDLEEKVEDADWFQYDKAWDELHARRGIRDVRWIPAGCRGLGRAAMVFSVSD